MPQASIRRANTDDARALSGVGAATFVETFGHLYAGADLQAFLALSYGLERTRADLADPAQAAWLVESEGQPIGYALAGPCALPHADVTRGDLELKRFYLLQAWQNGGLGGRLFAEVMAWTLADGPRALWIGVWSLNLGAQRFYARQGFEKVGEYDFPVGATVDREFILRRPAQTI